MALSLQRYTTPDIDSTLHHLLKQRSNEERERSMLISVAAVLGNRLPENLVIEILSWLPVKDLLQYKTVCKSWHAIISTPQFISKHLKNTRKIDDNCLLAQYFLSNPFDLPLFELLLDQSPRVLAYEVLYNMPMYGSHVCGPCDGLYYLYDCGIDSRPHHLWNPTRALWNPAINQLRALPLIISKPDSATNTNCADYEGYGFGSDPITGDYKVVVIKGYRSSINQKDVNNFKSVFVYSLRTDSWKYCGDLAKDYILAKSTCYNFVKGCCFWLGTIPSAEGYDDVIISFDMASDSFQEIPIPNYITEKPGFKSLGIYGGSLAYFTIFIHELEIWTLNDRRWTKKSVILQDFGATHVIGYWKDDKLLVETHSGKLVLYDPVTKDVKDLVFKRDQRCQGVFACMESLVSIKDTF